MKCGEVRELLMESARGGASAGVLQHVQECAECKRALQNQKMLSAGMKALVASDTDAPSRVVEAELLARFALRARPRSLALPWGAVAAAAAILAGVFIWTAPRRLEEPLPPIAVKPPEPVWMAPVERASVDRPKPARRRVQPAKQVAVQAEVESPFVPIPYAAPLLATERAEFVRVNLSATALASLGMPVSGAAPDTRLNAELMLGENGLARAVRLVK
jgi:hypothetical protein